MVTAVRACPCGSWVQLTRLVQCRADELLDFFAGDDTPFSDSRRESVRNIVHAAVDARTASTLSLKNAAKSSAV